MDGYPHEGGAWLELGRPGFDDLDRRQQIRWLVAVGWNGYTLVDPGRIAVLEQALALGGQERWGSVMWAYLLWALLQSFQALFDRGAGGSGQPFAREATKVLDEFMTRTGQAHPWWRSLWLPASVYLNLGMLSEAVSWLDRTRGVPVDRDAVAWQIFNEGTAAVTLHLLGRHAEAYEAGERLREFVPQWLGRTRRYYAIICGVVPRAVTLAAVKGADEGRAYVRDMLPEVDKLQVPFVVNNIVIGLAAIAALEGDWHRAAVLHEATAAAGAFRDPTGFALSRHYGALIRQHLSDGERRACRREAWSLTLQEAVSFGLAAG